MDGVMERRGELASSPSPSRRGVLVVVEGPTGAGKSTLVERLQDWLDVTPMLDPFEANPFLADSYRPSTPEGARCGVVVELTFLGLRIDQLRQIEKLLSAGRSVLTDWSMHKQPIFAGLTLTDADRKRIALACGLWSGDLPAPDLIVYLQADVPTLAERIARRGRPMEASTPTADLTALCAAYDAALALPIPGGSRVASVLTVDATTFNVFDERQVADLAAHIRSAVPALANPAAPAAQR